MILEIISFLKMKVVFLLLFFNFVYQITSQGNISIIVTTIIILNQ